MSKSLLFAGAVALFVGGCASSVETERRAQAHDTRARQAAAYEDYNRAADEKHEGDRLHAKAARERVEETDGQLAVPGPPAPPPPLEEVPPPPPAP